MSVEAPMASASAPRSSAHVARRVRANRRRVCRMELSSDVASGQANTEVFKVSARSWTGDTGLKSCATRLLPQTTVKLTLTAL